MCSGSLPEVHIAVGDSGAAGLFKGGRGAASMCVSKVRGCYGGGGKSVFIKEFEVSEASALCVRDGVVAGTWGLVAIIGT